MFRFQKVLGKVYCGLRRPLPAHSTVYLDTPIIPPTADTVRRSVHES
jgi:hypothetical protein